jgi:hypothetical protein
MRLKLIALAIVSAAIAAPAAANPIRVVWADGYAEIDDNPPAVRVCNENAATPLGDDGTGYLWINPSEEDTTPTYGNTHVGFGDDDGDGPNRPNDCP